jgi:hypothetical protein
VLFKLAGSLERWPESRVGVVSWGDRLCPKCFRSAGLQGRCDHCTERHVVLSQELPSRGSPTYSGRDLVDTDHGEEVDEVGQGVQPGATGEGAECSTVGTENDLQCDLRVHGGRVFRPDALRSVGRCHRPGRVGTVLAIKVTISYRVSNAVCKIFCCQTGRCTLEAAVRLIEERSDWNAKVVYGDTDSVFVLLKGRSKADAFRIGQEIADAVTASNPRYFDLQWVCVISS